MKEVLTHPGLSPTAKVLYALLDDMGQGQPLAIKQTELADLMGLSRKTVIDRLTELRATRAVVVESRLVGDRQPVQTYRTRVIGTPESFIETVHPD